jgi:toxin CptA
METCKYSDASVAFTLGPSGRLAGFIVFAAALSLVLVIAMPLPPWGSAAAAGWCLALFCHALARHLRLHEVRITGGTAITVDDAHGHVVSGSFVAPWLTIIHWRRADSRFTRTLVILPDAIDASRFRELRVILRWAPP